MKSTRAGVDIAKHVFHVHAVDRHDRCQWQAKLKRAEWLDALGEHLDPGAEVAMEACASAHHWGRELQRRGYRVKLIAAQFVKPYVKSNKGYRNDKGLVSLTRDAVVAGYRGIEHATERLGACRVGQQGDAQR